MSETRKTLKYSYEEFRQLLNELLQRDKTEGLKYVPEIELRIMMAQRHLNDKYGITASQITKKAQINHGYFSVIASKLTTTQKVLHPSATCIRLICKHFPISPEWLIMGTGPMMLDSVYTEKKSGMGPQKYADTENANNLVSDEMQELDADIDRALSKTTGTQIRRLPKHIKTKMLLLLVEDAQAGP